MTHAVTWFDKLRIERLVWAVDQQLYDLPRRSRIATRREVRDNLRTAAHDVGTTEALRHLGSSSQLAHQYLTAEFGDGPRPSWITASYYAALFPLVLNFFMGDAMSGFKEAISAASPHATGTFTWSGISYLQHPVVYTFAGGHGSFTGGDWSLLCYALWAGGTILSGRLWRLRSRKRRQRAAVTS
jgi:hypothetical protein